jgi:hypothetical protein
MDHRQLRHQTARYRRYLLFGVLLGWEIQWRCSLLLGLVRNLWISTLHKLLLLPYIPFHYVCTIDREGGDQVRIYIRSEQSQVGMVGSGLGGYLLGAQDHRTGAPLTQDFSRFSFLWWVTVIWACKLKLYDLNVYTYKRGLGQIGFVRLEKVCMEWKYYDSDNFICIVKVWRWIEEVNFALYILKVDSLGSPITPEARLPSSLPEPGIQCSSYLKWDSLDSPFHYWAWRRNYIS